MPWIVIFHPEFEPEFKALPRAVRVELAASAKALEARGPMQGRPLVDTLKGSKHANMKELLSTRMTEYGVRPSHSIPNRTLSC